MNTQLSHLWVGAFIKTGALIVYDPELQHAGHEWINLYSVNLDGIRPFERDIVREKIRKAKQSDYASAVEAYAKWKESDNGAFNAGEALAKEQAEKLQASNLLLEEQQKRIDRHKEFLSKLGKQGSAKLVEPRQNRATHCYSCKCHLDSESNLECITCHWLVCACGACGCGFSRIFT